MLQTFNLPIGQGSYESESAPLSAQLFLNIYPSTLETLTITDVAAFGTPGLEMLDDAGTGNTNRGGHVFNGVPYFVNGDRLYRNNLTFDGDDEVWELVDVGEIPGSKRVKMADNGIQLCIVVPEIETQFNAYILDINDVLVQVSDAAFLGPAASVIFDSSFFLFINQDGDKLFKSAVRDGLSYNALDFASAESDPDKAVDLIRYRNQIIVFGTKTLEGFQIVGTADFPYIPSGVVEQKGLISGSALTEVEGRLFWLGGASKEKPQILMYDGGIPQRVSTRAIEFALKKYSRGQLEAAFSWDYSEDGSDFIGFTFPDTTYVYDLSTGVWHNRQSKGEDGALTAFRVSVILEAYSFLLVADIFNGKIGRISKDVTMEYDEVIEREIIFPPFDNKGERTFVTKFELVAQVGVGLLAPQLGDKAPISLSFSDDGTRTWSQTKTKSLGVLGNYKYRPQWLNQGSFDRSRVYKLRISAPVKIAFYKAEVTIDR
jgi:hypothetical protein